VTLVDSHTHLDDSRFDEDREEAIARAIAAGVKRMVAVGTGGGPPDLEAGIRLAERHDCIYATVGVHPHDASKAGEEALARLAELARHPKVIAIGEIGLDYHYDLSPREIQREVFARQLAIAAECRKPVVIHTREAWDDTMAMLRNVRAGGILHCFSGDEAQARQALDLGFHLGFGGVLTFAKADALRRAARFAPLDRIVVETDCPYLAPAPHRGKRNEPAFVVEVARRLAEERGETLERIAEVSTENFERVCLQGKGASG
jgi:TatD DNase family protein